MKLRWRLQRLEQHAVDTGCPACRDRRGRMVLLTAQRQADGTVVVPEQKPQPCALCGQVPEQIIEVIETLVDEPACSSARETS